jgi:hypothetical protein
MKVLIDSDVLLDVGLNRPEFVLASSQVLRWAAKTKNAGVAWHSLTNCSYVLKDNGRKFLEGLLEIVDVVSVSHSDARRALQLPMNDLEDAFQASVSLALGADWIITRNLKDYKFSPVPAIDPQSFLQKVSL